MPVPKPAAPVAAPVAPPPVANTFAKQAAAVIAAPPPVPTAVVPPAVETVIPPPIAGTPAPPVGGLATPEAAPAAPQLGDAQARVDAAKPDATPATTATNAIADALKKRKVGFAATQFTGEGGVQGLLGRVGQRRQLLG